MGAATAQLLHDEGSHIAVIDLQIPEAAKKLESPRLRYFKADITDSAGVQQAVAEIEAWRNAGSLRLSAILCCAGFLGPAKVLSKKGTPFALDTVKKVIDVSLIGTIDVIRQFVPTMAAQDPDAEGCRGVVITVSSAAAFDGQEGQVAYSAAKGAIASMTLPLARDLSTHGIRAVCVAPGLFETTMTAQMPAKAKESLQRSLEFPPRGGRPDEFAGLVKQIIENNMLNGTVIRIDGAARMPSRL